MRRVGYISDPLYLQHLTGPSHPERPQRLEAITQRVAASGLASHLKSIPAQPADTRWINLVHDQEYVDRVRETCARGARFIDSMDTGISEKSFDAALLATGAALAGADALMAGEVDAAFAAVRPPGHHALRDAAMGFCLFNSAAILARYLQNEHGLERVFILDWDVHHGNGTQDAFYEDPTVFYASIHQYPFYPGSGSEREAGTGEGHGFTLNVPMSAGRGDAEYEKAIAESVIPAMERFHPQAVIISAGFDAHRDDPLAGMQVSVDGYSKMTKSVLDAAAALCPGRLLSILEGGYDLNALASSVETHIGVLLDG